MRKKIDDGGFETPYRLRKQVVEPVFRQIKQARGFRQFLLRGVKKVRAEWAMICTTTALRSLSRSDQIANNDQPSTKRTQHWFPTEVADYLQDFYEDLSRRQAAEGGGLRDGGLTLIGCACRLPSGRHRPVDE